MAAVKPPDAGGVTEGSGAVGFPRFMLAFGVVASGEWSMGSGAGGLLDYLGGWSVVGGALVAWLFWRLQQLKTDLANAGYRERTIAKLRHPDRQRWYLDRLSGALNRLDRFFGDTRPLSLRAYGVCITVALIYALATFVLFWAMGGPGSLGATEILPEELSEPRRWGRLLLLVAFGGGLFLVLRYEATIKDRARRTVRFVAGGRLSSTMADWTVRGGAAVLAVFVVQSSKDSLLAATVSDLMAVLTGVGTLTIVVGGAAVAAGTVSAGSAGALAAAIALGLGFASFAAGPLTLAKLKIPAIAMMLLFWLILPAINALWDALSWGLSRWLGRRLIASGAAAWSVVWHTAADLVGAVVCLFGLAVTLPAGVMLFDMLVVAMGGVAPLDIVPLLHGVAEDPFGSNGLWVTSMLLTTLIPTAGHLIILIGSAITLRWRESWRLAWADRLEREPDDIEFHGHLAWRFALVDVAAVGLFLAGAWGLYALVDWADWPVGYQLLHVALWVVDVMS